MRKIGFISEEQDRLDGVFGYQEIILKMNDGNIYSCRVSHPRGEPQNPQTPEEFEANIWTALRLLTMTKKRHRESKT